MISAPFLSVPSPRPAPTVFGTALAIRLLSMAAIWIWGGNEAFTIEDSAQFLTEARHFAAAGTLLGFTPDGTAVFSPKIMPLAAALFALTRVDDAAFAWRVILIQNLLDSLSCVLIALSAGSIDRRFALPAGLVAALNPTMITVSNLLLSDTLCLVFQALLLYAALRLVARIANHRRGEDDFRVWPVALTAALAIAGGTYTRFVALPLSVFLAALLAAAVLWRFGASGGRALPRLGALAVAGAIALTAIQPVALRNQLGFSHYAFSDQSGAHLLYWVVPMARDLSGMQPRQAAQDEARERLSAMIDPEEDVFDRCEAMVTLGWEMLWETGGANLIEAWTAGAILNVGMPAVAINPVVRALPHESFYDASGSGGIDKILSYAAAAENRPYAAIVLASGLGTLVWLGLCALGIRTAARADPLAVLVLLGWCAVALIVTGPVVSPKYRLPLEPALCVFVGAAIRAVFLRRERIPGGFP